MALRDIIKEIEKLSAAEQYRLKEYLTISLDSYSACESVMKKAADRKREDGYECAHCHSSEAVRFGKYSVKVGKKTMERQRYRCKDCGKTFTDVTNVSLYRLQQFGLGDE
ncbi:hypothetical protein IDH41_12205 [Paenibacillus sp. IB182493]|uniref:Uncharacterized protein n=1 Tax=Paenibacillus arenilitoris TaxID=2772299 RepID=A0A927H6B8_9BACL|nr:hypothetical protein [Paenibacillus arenilitoris]